jgi:hypothetical protein
VAAGKIGFYSDVQFARMVMRFLAWRVFIFIFPGD